MVCINYVFLRPTKLSWCQDFAGRENSPLALQIKEQPGAQRSQRNPTSGGVHAAPPGTN